MRIDADAPELHTVPWELLREPAEGTAPAVDLAASNTTPFSRYLALPVEPGRPVDRGPLKVLVAIAAPTDLASFDLAPVDAEREWQTLQAATAGLPVELVRLEGPCTLPAIEEALRQGCHVLHYLGHGAYTEQAGPVLFLADDANHASPVKGEEFVAMLGRLAGAESPLRLVFLASCQTAQTSPADAFRGLAPQILQAGVPAVLAMQDLVPVDTARTFAETFYQQLLHHGLVDLAANEARATVITSRLPGAAIPVLYMRVPSGAIWGVPERPELPLAAVVGIAVVAVLALSVLLWIAFNTRQIATAVNQPTATATPSPTPARMTGAFNIAVANFGQMDPVTGEVQDSPEGQVLSQWLFENLDNELRQSIAEIGAGRVEIWHDSLKDTPKNVQFGVIKGATAEEREQAAAELAKTVNATMVIYGNILPRENTPELEMAFYVSPALGQDEFGAVLGAQRLGKPIPGPFDAANPLAGDFVIDQLAWRSRALYWLTLGLTQQLRGQSEEALRIFERAEQDLTAWPQDAGKEILYFFIGREHFFLANKLAAERAPREAIDQQLDAAQAQFERALSINGDYVRAKSALGGVYRKRAELTEPIEARLQPPNDLERAIQLQEEALQAAAGSDDPLLEALVRAALAGSYRLMGETYYLQAQDDQAIPYFQRADAEVAQAAPVLERQSANRLLAQALETQGAANVQLADSLRQTKSTAEALQPAQRAVIAYEGCIAQAEKARFDEILQNNVISPAVVGTGSTPGAATEQPEVLQGCQQGLAIAQTVLQELQGAQP